jgi:hydroxyacylglutathione hydrolase
MLEIKAFEVNPLQENTYIIHNETRQAIIIDPGCFFTAEEELIKDYIAVNNLQPVKIINTHCHFDHVFGSKWATKQYGLEMWIHEAEEPIMRNASQSVLKYGLGFDNYTGPLHYLQEGDTVTLGDDVLQVLFTPGHSPGSISFYCAAQQFVISGDVLFRQSVGRTDIPGGDFAVLENSIRTRLYTLPDATVVYPGHGGPTSIGYEKKFNPFVTA